MIPDALGPLVAAPARSAVLVDFDGSLAPIVDDPRAAVPLPAALAALDALVGKLGLVGVVSGRPVAFLRDALALDGVAYVGQYGLERLVDGAVLEDPRVAPMVETVAAAAADAEARFPHLYVERKGRVAVTLHWRRSPEEGDAASAWASEAGARLGLTVYPTRMAVELRPPVPVDKGSAVEQLCAGLDAALFAGDDHGDLAAFDALDRLVAVGSLGAAVRVGVRSSEEPAEIVARADIHVDGPAGLAALLADLAAEI